MRIPKQSTGLPERKVILSSLWIFAMLNYIYADILTRYFGSALQPQARKQLLAGQVALKG